MYICELVWEITHYCAVQVRLKSALWGKIQNNVTVLYLQGALTACL